MFIKSDKKMMVLPPLTNIFNELIGNINKVMKNYYTKLTIVFFLFVLSGYSWFSYSGPLSVWLSLVALTLLADIKNGYSYTIMMSFLLFLCCFTVSTFEHYKTEPIEKEIVINKYEFVTDNEKLVIFTNNPSNSFVFNHIPSKEYYTLRNNDGKPMYGKILKSTWYDHIDKLTDKIHLASKHEFDIEITIGDKTYVVKDYCDRVMDKNIGRRVCAELF